MQSIRVVAGNAMPPGSVANLTGMTVTYDTARYERGVRGLTGTNDLVNPENGNIDTAQVALPRILGTCGRTWTHVRWVNWWSI
ncbi:MAG: hypothetical protein IPH00_06245 [Flavobacteriales bacterium]|nr:hypothetical protein [Flavobacteriales bacterium]